MQYIILGLSIINLLLGIIVLIQTKKEMRNITFLIFAATASLWTFSNFLLRINPDVFFLRLSYGLGIFVALLGLIWIHFFLQVKLSSFVKYLLIPFSFILFIVTILSNYIIESFDSITLLGYNGNTGSLFSIYSLYLTIILGYLLYRLYRGYSVAEGSDRKNRIAYISFGAIIFISTSAIVSFFIPVVFNTLAFTILDNFSFSFFLLFISFAIIKYGLFNIKVIAAEVLTFIIWASVVVQIFLSETLLERILQSILLVFVIIFGILLVKSVVREVEHREEIERLAKDLKHANVRLKELDKLKSEFVSIASHQLRSPLTAMKGYASLLLEGSYGKIPAAAKEAVENIFKSTDLMVDSVDDFLNVSRIEQGRMKYEWSEFNVADLARDVYEEQKTIADEQGVKLLFNGASKITIKADIGKLKQVLTNLIDNAIKYSPKGEVTVSIIKADSTVRFSVKDTGVGMTREDINKLFGRFVRAKGANKVNVKGTGLGLYVAKQMVEAHKGKIWAESEGKGLGSTFIVELPIA